MIRRFMDLKIRMVTFNVIFFIFGIILAPGIYAFTEKRAVSAKSVEIPIIATTSDPELMTRSDLDEPIKRFPIYFDPHSHTTFSDGNATPEQNLLWHIEKGFNAIAVTDHNNIVGALETQRIAREKYNDTIKVLVGTEWTTNRIHMSLIGINKMVYVPYGTPSDEHIKKAISDTHAQGGVAVVNHLVYSKQRMPKHPSLDQLTEWGIDYVEILNDDVFDYDSYQYCQNNKVAMTTGTDMHQQSQGVYGWTILIVAEFTEEAILAELLGYNTTIVYDEDGVTKIDPLTAGAWDMTSQIINIMMIDTARLTFKVKI